MTTNIHNGVEENEGCQVHQPEIMYLRTERDNLNTTIERLEEKGKESKERYDGQARDMKSMAHDFNNQRLNWEKHIEKANEGYGKLEAELKNSSESLAKEKEKTRKQAQELEQVRISYEKLEERYNDQAIKLKDVMKENEQLKSRNQIDDTQISAQESMMLVTS